MEELLKKKDDDATVLDYGGTFGGMMVETSLTEIDGIQLVEILDEDTEEEQLVNMDVYVRMIQIVFLVNTVLAFTALFLGMAPYFLLMVIPHPIALYTTIGLGSAFALAYILMLIFQSEPVMVAAGFLLCLFLGALSAMIRNASPLQTATAVFMQSVVVVLYAAISRRGIETWIAGVLMVIAGIGTWAIGIYAFTEQQDWISGGVVLALVGLFAIYSSIQIYYIDRFSLSKEHMTQAVVHFYGDPILFFRCRKGVVN